MKDLRVLLMEDGELIDISEADTIAEAETFIETEGVVGVTYYVINLRKCSTYHVERELCTGKSGSTRDLNE